MATDINGGQKSDIVEKILYKQIRRLLREDLKSLLKNSSIIKIIKIYIISRCYIKLDYFLF